MSREDAYRYDLGCLVKKSGVNIPLFTATQLSVHTYRKHELRFRAMYGPTVSGLMLGPAGRAEAIKVAHSCPGIPSVGQEALRVHLGFAAAARAISDLNLLGRKHSMRTIPCASNFGARPHPPSRHHLVTGEHSLSYCVLCCVLYRSELEGVIDTIMLYC
jgi:hypothetical protein